MRSAWLRGLLVLGAVAAFAAATVWPQSLGELAAKEKKRRKGTVEKVYTNDDLGSDRGGPSNLSQPGGAGAAPSAATPGRVYAPSGGGESEGETARGSGAESEGESEGGEGEGEVGTPTPRNAEAWRQRVEQQRRMIEAAETRIRQLEGRLVQLEQDVQPPGADVMDPQRLQNREAQKAELRQQLDAARETLEQARADLAGTEEEARRAGVPPGWLR